MIIMTFYQLEDLFVSDNRDESATMRAMMALALVKYE